MRKPAAKTVTSIIALILVAGLLFTSFAQIFVSTAYGADNKTKLAQLRAELAKAKTATSQLQSELNSLSDDKSTQMDRKIALEQQINSTQEEIAITEEMIVELDGQIAQRESDLSLAQANEAQQYELFKTRVRAMYENDNGTILDLIFSAGSFTEIFTRMEYSQDIAAYDQKVMTNLTSTREYIEELKSGLEADRSEQDGLKTDLLAKEADLTAQTEEVEAIIDSLNEQIDNKTMDVETAKKLEEEYQKQINATLAEIKKAEEEAAKKKAAEEAARKKEQEAAAAANASKYNGGQMKWPLPGYYTISSDYVMRDHPTTGVYSHHTGIDIPAPKGTKILAAADGEVIAVGYNTAYGNRVIVSHGGGIQTLYAHMSKTAVKVGQTVKAGDVLGYVGSTGYSTGNHLHFSVLKNGSYVSPWKYVSK